MSCMYISTMTAEPDGSSVSLVWEDSESLTAVIKTRNATYTIEVSDMNTLHL